MKALSPEEVNDLLKTLDGWTLENNQLFLKLTFRNFVETFSFMTQVAMLAEQINHHPSWFNVYNVVEIYLSTHDVEGITYKDFELAKNINTLLKSD